MKKRSFQVLFILVLLLLCMPVQSKAAAVDSRESVSFYCHNKTGYVGFSDIMNIYFTSEGTEETYTMTSSDESVVKLGCSVFGSYTANYLKPGTAVITVTTASGLSDQCTITVVEMESFELNDSKTITVQPEDVLIFEFEYEEYGDYVFFSADDSGPYLKSETKDANIYYNLNRHYFTLDEYSEFCRLSVYNNTDSPQTYTVKLMKAVPVESISLNVGYPGAYYVGGQVRIEAELYPENAKQENLTWTSNDMTVATLDYWTWFEYIADFVGAGPATITVLSESGASASLDIRVDVPKAIAPGGTIDVILESRWRSEYTFTPEASGEYVICSEFNTSFNDLMIDVYNDNGDILYPNSEDQRRRGDSNGNVYLCNFYLFESGMTYTLRIENNWVDGKTRTGTFHIFKTVPANKISFDDEQLSVYDGDSFEMNLLVFPFFAEPQEFIVQVNDASVVSIFDFIFGENHIDLSAHNPGVATLTAVSNSGLSASCDITVVERKEYTVISGSMDTWAKNSNSQLVFEIDAAASKFEQLWIDQSDNTIDPIYYAITDGSQDNTSKISINSDFLNQLALGLHGIVFEYQDGTAACGFTIVDTIEQQNPFTDVPEGKFYYEPVLWAVEQGITSGTTATTFSPDDTCTRGQVVTFLWRAAGKPEPKSTSHPFTDVKEGAYYYKAMLWAVENNITSGTSKTTFAPNNPCTRGQVVTFLWRAKDKPAPTSMEHPFTDVAEGKYYYTAMLWAVENNITSGTGKATFAPDKPCTRGQVVTFLYRAYA